MCMLLAVARPCLALSCITRTLVRWSPGLSSVGQCTLSCLTSTLTSWSMLVIRTLISRSMHVVMSHQDIHELNVGHQDAHQLVHARCHVSPGHSQTGQCLLLQ
jgi:hypothetical protein